jgi:heat shock protein HslJ
VPLLGGGTWIGSFSAGATTARYWFFQDFAAGSGPNITLTDNDNGSGGSFIWSSANVVDDSAVVTDTDGNPIYDAAAEDPTDLVTVTAHTGASVTLSAAPDAGQGTVRVWYLYAIAGNQGPTNLEVAPRFVKEVRSQHLDTRYLNSSLNLSDLTDASIARTNLGFNTQTAGQVLYGNGTSTFTSEANLFWNATDDRLGIRTNTPSEALHVFSDAASVVALLETNFTGANPILRFDASNSSGADLANANVVGQIDFVGAFNTTTGTLARIDAVYKGDGTTQNGDLVFYTAQSGSVTEVLRLNSSGQIDTTLGAGAVQSNASGILSSGTLTVANGGTGATSFTSNAVVIVNGTGSALTSEAQLAVSRGGTGLSAVGNANELFGTNAAGNAYEHKAATLTADGTLTIPSGEAVVLPDGAVGTPSLRFSSDADTGIYYGGSTDLAIAANGSQAALFASALVTVAPAALFKTSIRIEDPGAGANYVEIDSPTLAASYTITLPDAQGASGEAMINDGSGNLSWRGLPVIKSGSPAVSNGVRTHAVTFGTAMANTNYSIKATLANYTDNNPQYQPVTPISKTTTGFTVEWNEATDSGNYVLEWSIVGHYDP